MGSCLLAFFVVCVNGASSADVHTAASVSFQPVILPASRRLREDLLVLLIVNVNGRTALDCICYCHGIVCLDVDVPALSCRPTAGVSLGEQLDQRQICGFCPKRFIADLFVGILRKANKNVAIGARHLLFLTKMSPILP